MKKFLLVFIAVIIIGIAVAAVIMSRQNDSGQKQIKTYDEYVEWLTELQEKGKLEFDGVSKMGDSKEECEEFFTENREKFLKMAKGEPSMLHGEFCAMLVEVGEDYIPYNGTYEQNAVIKEVFRGCNYEEGTEISVVQMGGATAYDNGETTLFFAYNMKPMIPGDTYLLFCEETELSYEMDKPQFRTCIGLFSNININNNNVIIVGEDTPVEDIFNAEILVGDPYSDEYLLEIRNEMLREYGLLEEEEM